MAEKIKTIGELMSDDKQLTKQHIETALANLELVSNNNKDRRFILRAKKELQIVLLNL